MKKFNIDQQIFALILSVVMAAVIIFRYFLS